MAWSRLHACVTMMYLVIAVLVDAEQMGFATQNSLPAKEFVVKSPADPEATHELLFAIHQQNLGLLDTMLADRSTPSHPLYQQWLTFEEVGNLTSNHAASQAVVDWLTQNNVSVSWTSARKEYIKAVTKISRWNELLDSKFSVIEDVRHKGASGGQASTFHRTAEFSLPSALKTHVSAVFNTIQTPAVLQRRHYAKPASAVAADVATNQRNLRGKPLDVAIDGTVTVTVGLLNQLYNIPFNTGDAAQQQMVFETGDEHFSPSDLSLFQQHFGLPLQAALDPSHHATTDCVNQTCAESNANLQYMMGIAQNTSTLYYYSPPEQGDVFVSWVTAVADMENPPLVHSITWSVPEQTRTKDILDAFNTEALKLAVMGVTIVVAGGRNGAAGDADMCETGSGSPSYWTGNTWTGKGYFPSFPATSPYVTAVGATMGPESGTGEIACQSQLGGVITSGGGFSTYYPQPSWQTDAVAQYFASLPVEHTPSAGYNPSGRAYPDVSLVGVRYQVYVAGVMTYYYGTSAAAEVFAGMVSLANAARAREGRPSLGFLNPTLYAAQRQFRDVTEGHNKCMAGLFIENPEDAECCESGFYASVGWDPVTGLGSVAFDVLQSMSFVNSFSESGSADTTNVESMDPATIFGIILGSLVALAVVAVVIMFVQSWRASSVQVVPAPRTMVYSRSASQDIPVAYVLGSK